MVEYIINNKPERENEMKANKTKDVTTAEFRKVERMVQQCMRRLMRVEYELNIPKGAQYRVPLHVRKTKTGGSSTGGRTGLHINLGYWQMGNSKHVEYKSYSTDPVIGDINVTTDDEHLIIVVAHEVAHYVQYTWGNYLPRFKSLKQRPHGDIFKQIYRYLRRDLVNSMITC
tara:strand:+ start:156 stop:671 length:516 start_codon:yes stop_codon:yes gene_type:complete